MSDNPLTRLNRIASEILPGRQIETTARGQHYYVFEVTGPEKSKWAFPPIWIDPNASDQQVKSKLSREFQEAFHPDSSPGDLSVPNLQTEANRPTIAKESVKPPPVPEP
jgi:hypothetical protein